MEGEDYTNVQDVYERLLSQEPPIVVRENPDGTRTVDDAQHRIWEQQCKDLYQQVEDARARAEAQLSEAGGSGSADGWTGFDPNAVQAEILNFQEYMNTIIVDYSNDFNMFNEQLFKSWASEKAVEFNSHLEALSSIRLNFATSTNDILQSAIQAAAHMATANGATFALSANISGINTPYMLLAEERDGIKGMNITLAKADLDQFDSSCQDILNRLADAPIQFSLFDPGSELITAYKTIINNLVTSLTEELNQAVAAMESAFETEEMSIRLGKTQAEQQLVA